MALESALVRTSTGELRCHQGGGRQIHRVGFAPDPWAWTPWQYADDGRFSGRWDDPDGVWRTVYAGQSRLACYLEVLAFARADPQLQDDLGHIEEDPQDALQHPTQQGGTLPESWRTPRRLGSARLVGWFAVPGDKESLPTIRAQFLPLSVSLRLPDVDAAAIRLAEPRAFTQRIAAWLYEQTAPEGTALAGVEFASRHGDGLTLWAVFERPEDEAVSVQLLEPHTAPITADDPDLVEAMRIHWLEWWPRESR